MKTVFILNGANLNMLGVREPEIYGTATLDDVRRAAEERAKSLDLKIDFRQSNFEGDIINWLHEAHTSADAVILNPGGFTGTSIAIMDAIKAIRPAVIELHITNIHRRDFFRPPSFVSRAAKGVICGFGTSGYVVALEAVRELLRDAPVQT